MPIITTKTTNTLSDASFAERKEKEVVHQDSARRSTTVESWKRIRLRGVGVWVGWEISSLSISRLAGMINAQLNLAYVFMTRRDLSD